MFFFNAPYVDVRHGDRLTVCSSPSIHDEKDQIRHLGQVNHGAEVVGALLECYSAVLPANDRDGSRRFLEIVTYFVCRRVAQTSTR